MQPYVFIDEAGLVADRENLEPTEAQLRNAYAAPGQALRWRSEQEVTAEILANCAARLQAVRGTVPCSKS